MKNQDHYVYIHRRKDNDEVFYIGEGRLNRSEISAKRSRRWSEIVKEANGFYIEYLYTNLTKQEAVEKENAFLINPDLTWNLVNVAPARKTLNLTPELFDNLIYNPESKSALSWKNKNYKRIRNSLDAGYLDKRGYWQVRVNNKLYAAHRIIWTIFNRDIDPSCVINHIDNNPSNNLIENLEQVPQSVNSRRSVLNKNPLDSAILYSDRNGYRYWTAFYHDLNSKRHSKNFNCDKYGDEIAKSMAINWRIEQLKKLNQMGAGYNINL